MSEHTAARIDTGQTNGPTVALVMNALDKLPSDSRTFNLNSNEDEQALNDYLLKGVLPSLIIKIIGANNGQMRYSVTSIQNALKLVLRTMMESSNIWLLNGTRALIDLEEHDRTPDENPSTVTCELFSKSQLLIYHPQSHRYIEQILSHMQQTSIHIPLITLLLQGDLSSIDDIVENIANRIPTIILKGTGLIANQLAELYQPSDNGLKNHRREASTEEIFMEKDLRRLNHKHNDDYPLVFVCQPGKDELDETILQTISIAMRIIDPSCAYISEFHFAMEWNKIEFAQRNILNYNTVIDWTDDELDRCLEMAIFTNAVPFVELLFEFGASLQRLALIGDPDLFKLNEDRRKRSELVQLMIGRIPVVTELDDDKRVKAYIRTLFKWTVENEYFELVMSICTRLQDSIIAMLLVCQWCQFKEQNDYVASTNYQKYRRQFEGYVADILNRSYEDNEEKTMVLLNEKSVLYSKQQPLVLIDDLCSKTLTSTKCMQEYMNRVWYGDKFHLEKNFTWELLICLVCLCPLLLFIPVISNRVLRWDKKDQIGRGSTLRKRLSYKFEPFRRFYQGNAVIRFHYNMVSYAAFLVLFSYVILFDYFPLNIYNEKRSNISRLPIPLTELFLHVFLASIAFEELRQVVLHVESVHIKSPYWKTLFEINRRRNTIRSYFKTDPWNILDLTAFTFWMIAFITRFIVREHVFEVSKICMSLDLCLWYMRCLHIFLASERLGPKLLMIFHTMKDLISFLFFILIFLLAYTITTYALISTSSFVKWSDATYYTTVQGGNTTGIDVLRNIIEWGTFKIFGSVSLSTSDFVEMKYSAQNDAYGFVTLILTITFLIIAYVLLLNNLIALFNFTIQRVHGESHQAWCYHFYVVLKEYEDKDMFVPPFNLLLYPLGWLIRKTLWKTNNNNNETFIENLHHDKEQLRRYQQRIAEKYWKEKQIHSSHQRLYTCRHCQRRGMEIADNESTFF